MPRIPEIAIFALDRALDTAVTGPMWLENTAIAQSLVTALRFGEQQLDLYNLLAFCVMPNHVHMVLEPLTVLSKIDRTLRELTARNANALSARAHAPFWQEETYEHWIWDPEERARLVEYTENDPVAAGLVRCPADWPWSSASHALTAQSLLAL